MLTWDNVKSYAKNLVGYDGPDAVLSDHEEATKARVLSAHTWERFSDTINLSYTAGADSIDLATNAYREVYRVLAVRVSGDDHMPPTYVTPGEYNRLLAFNWDTATIIRYWTQIGRKLYVLGQVDADKTLVTTYTRSPDHVNWSEMPDEFLDLAAIVLARKLNPLKTVQSGNTVTVDPTSIRLAQMEAEEIKKLIDLEYRQPARDYEAREDEMWVIRREQYDY